MTEKTSSEIFNDLIKLIEKDQTLLNYFLSLCENYLKN